MENYTFPESPTTTAVSNVATATVIVSDWPGPNARILAAPDGWRFNHESTATTKSE